METSELIKKVRKVEIKTRGISRHIFSGEYHSAFKGRGMAFSEVREYQPGDDIRNIDWNVTARFNHPYVKIFEEERELTVMLLVDISGSASFGTIKQMKKSLIIELCAVLSFSAMQNNDKIGVIFFSDKVNMFIPPKKGKLHILRIIRELIEFEFDAPGTDIGYALRYFNNMIKKRCISFIISDFISEGFEDTLKITSRRHDAIAIKVYDRREKELPDAGLIKFKDAETGAAYTIDSSNALIRRNYAAHYIKKEKELTDFFIKNGVDYISLSTAQDYIPPLMNFFKRREKRA